METKEKEDLYIESRKVGMNMVKRGGAFPFFLGKALKVASIDDIVAIKKAFPAYWKQYLEW